LVWLAQQTTGAEHGRTTRAGQGHAYRRIFASRVPFIIGKEEPLDGQVDEVKGRVKGWRGRITVHYRGTQRKPEK